MLVQNTQGCMAEIVLQAWYVHRSNCRSLRWKTAMISHRRMYIPKRELTRMTSRLEDDAKWKAENRSWRSIEEIG